MRILVKNDRFTGQLIFLHQHSNDSSNGSNDDNGYTLTIVGGRLPNGEIVKGANFKNGRDSISSTEKLNLSLKGDGNAHLSYNPDTKKLRLSMSDFPVVSKEDPQGKRISFASEVEVDYGKKGKSRVLLLDPELQEDIQYYMRAGDRQSERKNKGKNKTNFLMLAHASFRSFPEEFIALPTLEVISLPQSLYVVQSNDPTEFKYTSFVWQHKKVPDLQAETDLSFGFDTGDKYPDLAFPVLEKIEVQVDDKKEKEIKANIDPTDLFAFTLPTPANPIIGIPTREGEKIVIALPVLPTHQQEHNGNKTGGLLFTRTIGVPQQSNQ